MEQKYTPGPWEIDDGFVNGGGDRICQFWNKFEEDFQNGEANARLIAAAPEMAEALLKVLKCHEQPLMPDLNQTLVDVRAALQKAAVL